MRLDLDPSLMGAPPLELQQLLALGDRRGHVLVANQDLAQHIQAHCGSGWGRVLEQHRIQATGLSVGALRIRVHLGPTDWGRDLLSLGDAVDFVDGPLTVLLEDDHSDWHFVRRLADPPRRRLLDDAERRRALRVQHAGGINRLPSRLQRLAPAARRRMWVLFDRDVKGRAT